MILLFLASTLYHAIPHQRAKMWLKKFDHCAIYLLIAGTYTPFLLVGKYEFCILKYFHTLSFISSMSNRL